MKMPFTSYHRIFKNINSNYLGTYNLCKHKSPYYYFSLKSFNDPKLLYNNETSFSVIFKFIIFIHRIKLYSGQLVAKGEIKNG